LDTAVTQQLTTWNTNRYHRGIQRTVLWCVKCLSCGRDYEKRSKTDT